MRQNQMRLLGLELTTKVQTQTRGVPVPRRTREVRTATNIATRPSCSAHLGLTRLPKHNVIHNARSLEQVNKEMES